jgi:hypothetical protein
MRKALSVLVVFSLATSVEILAQILIVVLSLTGAADAATLEGHYLDAASRMQAQRQGAITPKNTDTPCFGSHISCGQTAHGVLGNECDIAGAFAADFWSFDGNVGDSVTVTMTSSNFAPFVDLQEPFGDSGDGAFNGGTTSSPAIVNFTLDNSGSWTIGAGNDADGFGDYTLKLECNSSAGNCTPSATALCLNGGRFKVGATFIAPGQPQGTAQVVKLTDETGYLWFFASTNVEAVVKVIDACSFNQRFWVYAGGLTDVQVTLTVTDTLNGTVKTYQNPQGAKFQPIQDSSAFATCP